ncbi:MAG: oligosaccharide flippase family protein, partial [Planctomycetota bacterium]
MTLPPTSSATGRRPSLAGGVGWSVMGQFGSQAINFLANLALVIPLGPEEFGVIGFAWAVLLLFDALVDFGTGSALVQRLIVDQKVLDTA